jgi:RHS repeat-associated protein
MNDKLTPPENSETDFSSRPPDDPLPTSVSMSAVQCPTEIPTHTVAEARHLPAQDPPDDDPPAGNVPNPPTPPPKPPSVGNSRNSLEISGSDQNEPTAKTVGVTYYGYRYFDPVTGRWLSRDPIEESGGVNLYNYINNHSINHSDFLGLYANILVLSDYIQDTADRLEYRETVDKVAVGVENARFFRMYLESMTDDEFYARTKNGIFARWYIGPSGKLNHDAALKNRVNLVQYRVEVWPSRIQLIQWMRHEENSRVTALSTSQLVQRSSIFSALDSFAGDEEYLFDSVGMIAHGNYFKGGVLIGPDSSFFNWSHRMSFKTARRKLGELAYFESRALISCHANQGLNVISTVINDEFTVDSDGCTMDFTPIQAAWIPGNKLNK